MGPRLVSDMMCVVGNDPLRQRFQSCIALPALGMLPWLILFSSLMAFLSGTLILLDRCMIGSWNSFPRFR
jgi:hypothetical protein